VIAKLLKANILYEEKKRYQVKKKQCLISVKNEFYSSLLLTIEMNSSLILLLKIREMRILTLCGKELSSQTEVHYWVSKLQVYLIVIFMLKTFYSSSLLKN